MRGLAVCGAGLVALVGAGLALHVPGADSVGSLPRTQVFVAVLAVAGAVYLLAVRLVLRQPMPKHAVWMVLLVALAMRALVLPAYPFLSSDVFRYVWDGRVQLAGINPYRYIPADPALAALQDQAIYPHVGRRDYAPTIYPPAAQLVFRAAAAIDPSVVAMKGVMVLFEAVTVGCLLLLLQRARMPAERVLIYAWNPLAVWAFAGNGHVDALACGFVALALLAGAWRRPGWAGAALGCAMLVKFLPAIVAPAIWRRPDWRMPAAMLLVAVALYAAYIDAGWQVLGFLRAYGGEEGFDNGQGFWLLAGLGQVIPLPSVAGKIYVVCGAVALAALAGAIGFGRGWSGDAQRDIPRLCSGAAILAAAGMAVLSPHYSWYFVWLAVPAAVAPYSSVIWLSVAPLLLYLNPMNERFYWASLVYLPAIWLAWRDRHRGAAPAGPCGPGAASVKQSGRTVPGRAFQSRRFGNAGPRLAPPSPR